MKRTPKLFPVMEFDLTFYHVPTAHHAYQISKLSCVLTTVAFLLGLIAYFVTSSPSILAYCFENAVDLLSSLVVVWRFYSISPTLTDKDIQIMDDKEKRASIAIAIILFVLGVMVVGVAINHLASDEQVTDDTFLLIISIPSVIIFGTLAWCKWIMANKLNSPAFRKDALCSFFGATLSLGVVFSSALDSSWLDGAVAIIVAIMCMWVGLRTILKNIVEGMRFWTLGWWQGGMCNDVSHGLDFGDGNDSGVQMVEGGGEGEGGQQCDSYDMARLPTTLEI